MEMTATAVLTMAARLVPHLAGLTRGSLDNGTQLRTESEAYRLINRILLRQSQKWLHLRSIHSGQIEARY